MQTETSLGHSMSVEIEKLDGGFISNVTGKRRIYKDAHDIEDSINLGSTLNTVDDNEYILSIALIPKNQVIAVTQEEHVINEDDGLSILERAKRDGIIQPADVFNPEPSKPVVDNTKPIAITAANAYNISQLQAIPWLQYDKDIPLTNRERSDISGITYSTMYGLWLKLEAGTFQWQSINTRIGMTILAKYYEKLIDKKFHAPLPPDVPAPTNSKRLLEILSELELVATTNKFVKASVLSRKILEMKKLIH
jgi:hypothetical protein